MNIVLVILLVVLFGFSLMMVLANDSIVAVDLLTTQVPAMNLGLILIICLVLGIAIGMLLALIVFRVFQMKMEISKLKKEQIALQQRLDEASIVINQNRSTHVVSDTPDAVLAQQNKSY